jgi:hypothetical protein
MTAFDAWYERTGYPHMTRHIALQAWDAALKAYLAAGCPCEPCPHTSDTECEVATARSLMANPEER